MAIPFDAAARLAEGRPAVDDLTEYVLACRRLGYQNPDLTADTSQIRDWYDGEAGLDLRALDADCAALAAAAAAAEDAARTHAGLAAELADVWSGRGAEAAREFASRSGQAATSVSSTLRGSADALTTLRDELWRAVDAKVATVQAIDGRHAAQRGEWLAAARTVTTGAGDLATASELVDQQVKPFVQNDVGSDFVGAMRAAVASIGAAYDAAIARTSSRVPVVFDVPGDLGPRTTAAERPGSDPGAGVARTTTPAAAGMPSMPATFSPVSGPAWSASPAGPPPVVDPAASAPLTPTAPAASSVPSMGDLGGAAPGLGGAAPGLGGAAPGLGGVSGFGQQLADLIGSLVGGNGTNDLDGTDDLAGIDGAADDPDDLTLEDPDDEDPDGEDPDGEDPDGEDPDGEDPDDEPDTGESADEMVEEVPAEPVPEPTPVPSPPAANGEPVVPPAAPESVAEAAPQTPCEIAADELPQVGE